VHALATIVDGSVCHGVHQPPHPHPLPLSVVPRSGALRLTKLKLFVLDEADQMLDRGFKDQIYEIFSCGLPSDTQVALFSATMPEEALELTKK